MSNKLSNQRAVEVLADTIVTAMEKQKSPLSKKDIAKMLDKYVYQPKNGEPTTPKKPLIPMATGANGEFFYPVTTTDQILKANGEKLEQNGKIDIGDIKYTPQTLTDTQKQQALMNIGIAPMRIQLTWQLGYSGVNSYEQAYQIGNVVVFNVYINQNDFVPTKRNYYTIITFPPILGGKRMYSFLLADDGTRRALIIDLAQGTVRLWVDEADRQKKYMLNIMGVVIP